MQSSVFSHPNFGLNGLSAFSINAMLGRFASHQRPSISSTISFHDEATVESPIYPDRAGRVQFEGTGWPARTAAPTALLPGTRVRVIGRQNITLIVEPLN